MPTTVIETIGTSQDYADIATWEAATDNNLTSADEVRIGRLNTSEFHDAVGVMAGATVDSTRYRQIDVASGFKHNGNYYDGGAGIEYTTGSFYAIHLQEDYVRIFDLRVHVGYNHVSARGIHDDAVADHLQVHRTIIRQSTGGSSAQIFRFSNTTSDSIITNSIAIGHGAGGPSGFSPSNGSWTCYNCTAINCQVGMSIGVPSGLRYKNCVAVGSNGNDLGDSGAGTPEHTTTVDASDISTAGGSNNRWDANHLQSDSDFFVSLTEGAELPFPKPGSDAYYTNTPGADLGTTPEFVNIDATGFDRDAAGVDWSRGAIQRAIVVCKTWKGAVEPLHTGVATTNIYEAWKGAVEPWQEDAVPAYTQVSFRFRNDDGSLGPP